MDTDHCLQNSGFLSFLCMNECNNDEHGAFRKLVSNLHPYQDMRIQVLGNVLEYMSSIITQG